jgi:hypothetical protein|tara:strand:+ start:11837 stop:11992 length:156 start_codon:yes stop_codon:yes gene_type:complete
LIKIKGLKKPFIGEGIIPLPGDYDAVKSCYVQQLRGIPQLVGDLLIGFRGI